MFAVGVHGMSVRDVADAVPRLLRFGSLGVRVLFRDQPAPMFDDCRCVPMNLHPHERIAKDMTMNQRALDAWVRGQVAKTALENERLPEPLDVAAREGQLSEFERRRLPRLSVS